MRKLMLLLLLAAVVPSCAPMETTRTEAVIPEVTSGRRGTYALVPFDETMAVGVFNEEVLEGLENALAGAVEARGYTRVKEGSDILVALYVIREGKFQSHEWGYRRGWRTPEWDAYWLERRAASRELEEGMMVVDVIDAKRKKHVWEGSTPPILFPAAEGEVENRKAEEAITRVVAGLP